METSGCKAMAALFNAVETIGCKAMAALFNANNNDSLASLRYNMLCKKLSKAKTFVTPERLPPTSSARKFHSLRSYYQVMEWMGCTDEIKLFECGWKVEGEKLVPVMKDKTEFFSTIGLAGML